MSSNMKGFWFVADTHKFSTCLPMINTNIHRPLIPCQSLVSPTDVTVPLVAKFSISWPNHASCIVQRQKGGNGFVVGCASWGLERELVAQEDAEKGRSGMTRFRHKCGERKGVVELLECLEKEAIMGEDVGKEPTDYSRRALIFDTSSQVFQAVKELTDDGFIQESP